MSENSLGPWRPASLALLSALLAVTACSDDGPDAYGNFEATEVVVSAEVGGTLVHFEARRGDRIPEGTVVGRIDTVSLGLQRAEITAQREATRIRGIEAEAQVAALEAQLETARVEHERTVRLFDAQAATAQQLNRAEGDVRVLVERIEAARALASAVREETGGGEARIRQIEDRIARSSIVNPVAGTVLTTYVERGEFVQPGAPLYRIADLDTLTLRAYVTGDQLAAIELGGSVRVQFDDGSELATRPGQVVWISPEAEFTPTPIQTRDERADQVYAVEIRVPNADGRIKIGMPGEVVFESTVGDGGAATRDGE